MQLTSTNAYKGLHASNSAERLCVSLWPTESIQMCSSLWSKNGSLEFPQVRHQSTTTASILLCCDLRLHLLLFLATLLLQTSYILQFRINHRTLPCSTQRAIELLHDCVRHTWIKKFTVAPTSDSRALTRGQGLAEIIGNGLEVVEVTVRSEEKKEDKIQRESFLSSLEKIAQRLESRKSESAVRSMSGQGPAGRPPDRPACTRCTAQPGRPPGRPGQGERSTGAVNQLALFGFCLSRSTDRSTVGQGRSTGPSTYRQTCSPVEIRTSFLIWSRIQLRFRKTLRVSGYK